MPLRATLSDPFNCVKTTRAEREKEGQSLFGDLGRSEERKLSKFVRSLRGRQKTFIRLRADGRGRRDGALTRRRAASLRLGGVFRSRLPGLRRCLPVGPLARSLPLARAVPLPRD